MDETGGFQCLGHSNGTICSLLSPICSENFTTFPLSYWGAHSYYPRGPIMGNGNLPTSELDETGGFQCLGHSKWTMCGPLYFHIHKYHTIFPSYNSHMAIKETKHFHETSYISCDVTLHSPLPLTPLSGRAPLLAENFGLQNHKTLRTKQGISAIKCPPRSNQLRRWSN